MNRRTFFAKAAAFVAGCALGLKAQAKVINLSGLETPVMPKGHFIAEFKYAVKDYVGDVNFIVFHKKSDECHA